MSKISPLMGVNARFGKEMRQTANALKKAAYTRFKFGGISEVAKETRAVFPELPCPDAKTLRLMRGTKNPIV